MSAGPLEHAPAADRCALLLGTLLQYAKHPATPNSPRWVSIMVPDDFLREAEEAIGAVLASLPPPGSSAHFERALATGE